METDNNKLVKQSSNVSIYEAPLAKIKEFASIVVNTKLSSKVKPFKGDIVTEDDVVAVILTGHEFGLKPMQSLQLADKLNSDGYLAITKGNALGLDVSTSLDNIHIINTSNGRTPFVGIHVVTGLLIKHKIDVTILLDNAPLYKYYKLGNNSAKLYLETDEIEDENYTVKDKYYIYSNASTPEEQKKAFEAGKSAIMRERIGTRTAVKLTRANRSPIPYCFSTVDATNEGVYPGIDKFGNAVEGQSTWIKHTRSKLLKTAIMRAARIIADDILNGVYTEIDLDYFVANGNVSTRDGSVFEDVKEEV